MQILVLQLKAIDLKEIFIPLSVSFNNGGIGNR